MSDILESLNEEQIKPVLDTEGAVLVLAGAGSGKTRVLTSRIAYILREGKAELSNVLAITFTNKAAGEMKSRLSRMLGCEEGDMRWICTIHSMCVKILRGHAAEAGLKTNFSIYSETERNNIIKKCFQELDYDEETLLKSAKFHIANAKTLGLEPDLYALRYHNERSILDIVNVYSKYEAHLKANNALDFDDLLIHTLRLLRGNEEVRDYLSDKFKYILVDEFQDTNAVQYNIIKLLASKHCNIFAVGDDDQSIYGWRGAEIKNILKFDTDYPSAKVYKLERNYRSTKNILNLANAVIKNNSARRGKTLWTEAESGEKPVFYQAEEEAGEALFTARKIFESVNAGGKYSDFAVLMRINALTRSYEQEFTKYGIPYKVFGGFKFFERREIKDVLAYLRLISNSFDSEACERIINVPRRGIGAKTVQAMNLYAEKTSLSFYDAAVDCEMLNVSGAVKEKLHAFVKVLKELIISSQTLPVAALVREVLIKTELRSAYDDGTDEGDGKLANLDEFVASVDDFSRLNPQATLDEYLNQVTLSSDTDDMDDGDYVTIATIHSVKGLEFPCVFICGLEDGIMPSSRADESVGGDEEERRLMYVAITRAEKRLYLTRSKSRYLYGKRDMTKPSRFLNEIADELGIKQQLAYSRQYTGYGYNEYGGREYSKTGYGKTISFYKESENASQGRAVYSSADGYESDFPQNNSYFRPAFGGFKSAQKGSGGGYAVGQRVRHPRFGTGMIVAVKNNGQVVNVAFEGQGIKELSASIAPLEIL